MTRPRATPSELLAVELNRRHIRDAAAKCAYAGVGLADMSKAMRGRQVNVNAFLRLCAAIQYDPCPQIPHPMIEPGEFQPLQFAMAFTIKQGLARDNDSQAAARMGCTETTVRRIKNAGPMTPSIVIKAAKYMISHPFSFMAIPVKKIFGADVSRETRRAEWVGGGELQSDGAPIS